MRLIHRLGIALIGIIALAPPATATSPPDPLDKVIAHSDMPVDATQDVAVIKHAATFDLSTIALVLEDQAITQKYNAKTQKITGASGIIAADIGPPDPIKDSWTEYALMKKTPDGMSAGRSTISIADDTSTAAPEYNLLCRQLAGHEHK